MQKKIGPDVLNQEKIKLLLKNKLSHYYGINGPKDDVKARQCALLNQDSQVNKINNLDILAMIYANGAGVKPNQSLAIKFSCLNQVAFDPNCADMAAVDNNTQIFYQCSDEHFQDKFSIVHILPENIEQAATQKKPLDICADIAESPFPNTMKACAKITDDQQETVLTEHIKNWTVAQQQAFTSLRKNATLFFSANGNDEANLENTNPAFPESLSQAAIYQDAMSAVYKISYQEKLKKNFQTALMNFEQGKFPQFSSTDFKKQDEQLNKVYAELIKVAAYVDQHADSQQNGYRDAEKLTQRTWLHYRDAWVQFAKIRYPQVAIDNYNAWLTEERVRQLEKHLARLQEFKKDWDTSI